MRIVSVLPSATEIVAALGHGRELVGRSAECDYPTEVRDLPVVMRPTVNDFSKSSREIDSRVREVRGQEESLYVLDIDLLRSLRPDLLLTQDLCGVCSVTEAEAAAACEVAGVAPRVVSLSPRTLEEVWSSVERVGAAVHDPEAGTRATKSLRRRCSPHPRTGSTVRVAIVEWLDPPILAGLWAPGMVAAAGGQSLGPTEGLPGIRTSWSEIAALHPDLLVLSPCSFTVRRTREEIARGGLAKTLGALEPSLGIFLADEAYFSRPGPRLADGVSLLRSLIAGEPPATPMPAERWTREAEAFA